MGTLHIHALYVLNTYRCWFAAFIERIRDVLQVKTELSMTGMKWIFLLSRHRLHEAAAPWAGRAQMEQCHSNHGCWLSAGPRGQRHTAVRSRRGASRPSVKAPLQSAQDVEGTEHMGR